jgi:hypothetical protein
MTDHDEVVTALKRDMLVIRWMMGFVLAMQVALFAKAFIH